MFTPTPLSRMLAVALGVVALAASLSGCRTGNDGPEPSRSPSPTARDDRFVAPPADIAKVDAKCVDGSATVNASNVDVTLGDCAKVRITASNSVVHLGNVEDLVVAGSINDVVADEVASVHVTGNGNRITTDGAAEHSGKGTDNVFRTR